VAVDSLGVLGARCQMQLHTRLNRRTFLAGAVGLGIAYTLATRRHRASAVNPSNRDLVWVWRFSVDGQPDEIGAHLLDANLGILLKTHDGLNWMADFDDSDYAVTGSNQVAALAKYYESAGIPFHAWCVVSGADPAAEAEMAAQVLWGGARSLYIDPSPESGSWHGDAETAITFGHELRTMHPAATLMLALDPRPWVLENVPVAELATFCDGISVKELWTNFDHPDGHSEFAENGRPVSGEGITPQFLHAMASEVLGAYDLPLRFTGDGSTGDPDAFRAFLHEARGPAGLPVSIWRYGRMTDAVFDVLRELPPTSGGEDSASSDLAGARRTHTVSQGDTLWTIAGIYGTSVDLIAEANSLPDPDKLSIGQELIIP
jgi:LysM domain